MKDHPGGGGTGPGELKDSRPADLVAHDDVLTVAVEAEEQPLGFTIPPPRGEILKPQPPVGGGVARAAPAVRVEGKESSLPEGPPRERLRVEDRAELVGFHVLRGPGKGSSGSEPQAQGLQNRDLRGPEDVGRHGAKIDLIPPTVLMVVLVVLTPVPVLATVESGISGERLRDFGLRHVIIGLALVEVVEPCFIYRFSGQGILLPPARRVGVRVPGRIRDLRHDGLNQGERQEERQGLHGCGSKDGGTKGIPQLPG